MFAVRYLLPVGVFALAALAAFAAPVLAASTHVADCNTTNFLKVKPSTWSGGCTGGSLNIRGLRWSSYARRKATATGRAWLRLPCGGSGEPTCPDAGVYKARARLTFSRPRQCENDTLLRYFSRVRVRVRYRKGNPYGVQPGWKTYRSRVSAGPCEMAP